MDSLPDPSGGSAQVGLNSLFDEFDLEPIKDLCFLHDDLEAIYGIQELFENENLGILPMQDDNYPSKRVGEKCTPVATSPSTSKFSIQGITPKDKEWKLTDARHRLTLALDSEAIKINQKVAIKANLDKALAREIELKKELESLSMQKAEFTMSSTFYDVELAQQQVIISQIKGEVSKIEATPTLEASDDAKLRELQRPLFSSLGCGVSVELLVDPSLSNGNLCVREVPSFVGRKMLNLLNIDFRGADVPRQSNTEDLDTGFGFPSCLTSKVMYCDVAFFPFPLAEIQIGSCDEYPSPILGILIA
nr:hypothetical protein CFP56_00073 [Quercus suber]